MLSHTPPPSHLHPILFRSITSLFSESSAGGIYLDAGHGGPLHNHKAPVTVAKDCQTIC